MVMLLLASLVASGCLSKLGTQAGRHGDEVAEVVGPLAKDPPPSPTRHAPLPHMVPPRPYGSGWAEIEWVLTYGEPTQKCVETYAKEKIFQDSGWAPSHTVLLECGIGFVLR